MTTITRPAKVADRPATRTRAATPPAAVPTAVPATPRPAGAGAERRRAAVAVPSAAAAAPRTPFVLLIVGLLGGALVSLLLLNTVLAEDAFTLSELQRNNKQLTQRQQALEEEIAREDSPDVLAGKARALGMVPARQPAFVSVKPGQAPGAAVPVARTSAARNALATAGAAAVAGLPLGSIGAGAVPPAGAHGAGAPRQDTGETARPGGPEARGGAADRPSGQSAFQGGGR